MRSAVLARRGKENPLLHDVGDFLARSNQLEDTAINFPVPELSGAQCVVTQVKNVQSVTEVVEHDTALAAEHADRA